MIYDNMKNVIPLYQKYWDRSYFEAYLYLRNYVKHNKIRYIKDEDIKRSISIFFKSWMKMMRIKWDNPRIIYNIKDAIKIFSPHLEKLKNEKMEELEFGENVRTSIEEIFNGFKNIEVGRRRLGAVGASKIMHIILPELFPMWDGQMMYAYGCKNNSAENYIKFMKEMQGKAKELLKSCNKTKEDLCKEFEFHRERRTLPKLIDEYNFVLTRKGYIKYFK